MRPVLRSRDTLLLASLTLVCVAMMSNRGDYSPLAFSLVLASLVFGWLAIRSGDRAAKPISWAIAAVVCAGAGALTYYEDSAIFRPLLGVLALLCAVAALERRARLARAMTLAAVIVLPLAAATQWHWGSLDHDVFGAVNAGAQQLLHGRNPYDASYWAKVPSGPLQWRAVLIPFSYGPGVAILALPGVWLGDARVMDAVGILLIGCACVYLARASDEPGRRRRVLVTFCAIPLLIPMLHFAWVDSMTMGGFAAWLLLRGRRRSAAIFCLGLCFAAKPTILLALLPFFLWSRSARREVFAATAVAIAAAIPFVIATGPGRFYADVVGVHTSFGTRLDSTSIPALVYHLFGIAALPGFAIILASGAGAIAVWLHRPRDLGDVLAVGAAFSTLVYLFSFQAYLNYYFTSAMLLVLALAARGVAVEANGEAPQRFGENFMPGYLVGGTATSVRAPVSTS